MSEDELVDLMLDNKKKDEELNWYKEQLNLLNKLRFASKSEKIISGQLNLFNEIEDIQDNPILEEKAVKSVKQKKQREANFSKLPKTIIEHTLDNKQCETCGTTLKELAPQVIDVLKYQPARYTIERHIVHQYICPTCTNEFDQAELYSADGAPIRLINGSITSPSVVAGIAFDKYVSGIPLYRQEQELKRKKVEISRANMSNWLMKCGELLEPLYEKMKEDLRKLPHVHMDETTVLVLEDKKAGRQKSYMWLGCSGRWSDKQMALYEYHESREYEIAKEIMGSDYQGSIHCDGYEAYHEFKEATAIGCMTHARRYFHEAMEVSPLHKEGKTLSAEKLREYCKENPSYGNIRNILQKMGYLFACEQTYRDEGLDIHTIKQRRQSEQKKVLDEIFQCLERYEGEYTAKSKMGKAITYALNQKPYLSAYLEDGATEISNNRAERQIKPFVIGRKNWLFSKTKSGAKMSSIYYNLIESAKLNHLDIYGYLEYILETIQNEGKQVEYETLLPYSTTIPSNLKIQK